MRIYSDSCSTNAPAIVKCCDTVIENIILTFWLWDSDISEELDVQERRLKLPFESAFNDSYKFTIVIPAAAILIRTKNFPNWAN